MKRYYEGSLPGRAETYEQVTELLIDREFFGLPEDYWEKEIQRIQQLTAQDIQQLAERYLDIHNFVLALVSKREDLNSPVLPSPPRPSARSPSLEGMRWQCAWLGLRSMRPKYQGQEDHAWLSW